MRQKCVIFGAGVWGDFAYQKLRNLFDVAVYSDNNPQLRSEEHTSELQSL